MKKNNIVINKKLIITLFGYFCITLIMLITFNLNAQKIKAEISGSSDDNKCFTHTTSQQGSM